MYSLYPVQYIYLIARMDKDKAKRRRQGGKRNTKYKAERLMLNAERYRIQGNRDLKMEYNKFKN